MLPGAALVGIASVHLYYRARHGVSIFESLGAMVALHAARAVPSTALVAVATIVAVAAMYCILYSQAKRSDWPSAPAGSMTSRRDT